MSATTAVPPDVSAYLAAVRAALGDLPPAERDDLVAEVELSVLDAAGEGGAIAARLGPPEEFAAELRAAAGLDASPPAAAGAGATARAWRRAVDWWGSERAEGLRRLAYELAPIWWVVRGYVAVAAFGLLFDDGWSTRFAGVPRLGGGENGLFAIVVVVVLSVLLGLSTRRRPRAIPLVAVLNALLVVAAFPVAERFADGAQGSEIFVEVPAQLVTPGLANDGVPVDNVYPYSRDGKLLHDVLLYDGAGLPIEVRPHAPDPDRRVPATVSGLLLYNVFPIRYFEPGTARVAEPNAGPPVSVPQLKTPTVDTGSTP